MDTPPPDDLKDGVDWGPFDESPTHLDGHAPVPEDYVDTGPHDYRNHPAFDLGRARGREEALAAFRLALIADQTDPGVAYSLAERLRRWMAVPENAALVVDVLKP